MFEDYNWKREEKASMRAFIDSNVLAHIVGQTKTGQNTISLLRNANVQPITFSKCVYELYSILKGTTSYKGSKANHPLKSLVQPHIKHINDIAQRLFKKEPDVDPLGNTYYWYNLCEEWRYSDYFEWTEKSIEELVIASGIDEAKRWLEKQREFVEWKEGMSLAFDKVRARIQEEGIVVYDYVQVFSSYWYKGEGQFYEQEFAKDSLLPNEDFELVLAAFFLEADVFVTEDDDGLIWRGGLSLGLNVPSISFCCPERLKEAIDTKFGFRFYRKK
jgi:hypothetical protein